MQPAPVAVVRVSGPRAWEIASRVFGNWPEAPESHRAMYGHYLQDGAYVQRIEDGLALPFSEGHSYTGEQAVELSIHGSPASVRWLVSRCIAEGARMAEPGEFTLRAFLNGRIDLTQAEGVRDTVNASTELQLKQAAFLREGVLFSRIRALRERVVAQLTAVEASVDFSEEIGSYDRVGASIFVRGVLHDLDHLISGAENGRIVREGFRIALVGPPNAGKSSLLNALLGTERAIVTEIAGTTRDYVEEQVSLGGVLCVLFDTAGLRDSSDRIESIGIQRTRAIAAKVDEVWYVYDALAGFSVADENNVRGFEQQVVLLANKCDLLLRPTNEANDCSLRVSALTGEGLDDLRSHVQKKVERAAHEPLINLRQKEPLENARAAMLTVLDAIEHDLPDDLLAVGLRSAAEHLGHVTGETATPDIIDRIFHDFCIGK